MYEKSGPAVHAAGARSIRHRSTTPASCTRLLDLIRPVVQLRPQRAAERHVLRRRLGLHDLGRLGFGDLALGTGRGSGKRERECGEGENDFSHGFLHAAGFEVDLVPQLLDIVRIGLRGVNLWRLTS